MTASHLLSSSIHLLQLNDMFTFLRPIILPFMTLLPGPVSNKIITGSIPLAYISTVFVPLILFHDQKDRYTFRQSNMSHGRAPDSGTTKYRRSGATPGECLTQCIAG
ncbi:hypothetical protein TNCV_1623941 [Trichonephila clavipes]|nr:hypothetical protein TNCV_1623941 [Trichonephila clavipes]